MVRGKIDVPVAKHWSEWDKDLPKNGRHSMTLERENEILKKALVDISNYVDEYLKISGQGNQNFQHIKQIILGVMVGNETDDGIELK